MIRLSRKSSIEFNNQLLAISSKETICALATSPGGALGIIRVSGSHAFDAVSSICHLSCNTIVANTIHYTHITNGTEVIDEAMVSVFKAPRSYTGEDCVEISCHGSRYILNKVLELLVQKGCRMAAPGEFTQRAYLNGKMDLAQAEAVADLIASTNRSTHHMAISQLRGGISSELSTLRDRLLHLTSLLELELDFSDHEDLEFADRKELQTIAEDISARITRLAQSFKTGQALKQGIPVAIIGKTNVGKSTLLNRLLHEERAIVSDIHGTTRDTIEDTIDIKGITFRFIDTAGIRQTTDTIEQIGIERTFAAVSKARIVIFLMDENTKEEEIQELQELTQDKETIILYNKADKIDLQTFSPPIAPQLCISAKTGYNLDKLEAKLLETANIPELNENDIIVTSARQYDALLRASQNLENVLTGLHSGLSGDLISEDLRLVLDDLADITGQERIVTNEVLENIFSHFCVGK